MSAGKVIGVIVGAISALVAVGLLVGGIALAWVYGTQRDAEGFIDSPTYELTSSGYAITSTDIDLTAEPNEWFPSGLFDVRLDVRATDDAPVFVGIGPTAEVGDYLTGVAHSEVSSIGDGRTDVTYTIIDGGAPATLPAAQSFWAASAEGVGNQSVTWDVESGAWSVVVMQADTAQGVTVEAEGAVKVAALLAVTVAMLLVGLFLAVLAAALLVWGTRSARAAEPLPAPVGRSTEYPVYPVMVEGRIDPNLSRGMWLIKWFLAIPHYIALAVLFPVFLVLTIGAFFAILFTGRYPRSIFDFNVGVLRWGYRVGYYAFNPAATDKYPPFALRDMDYPARLDVAYPEQLSRGLVLVKWWLLAIPHYLIVGLFTSGLVWWTTDVGTGDNVLEIGGGLIGLLTLVALVILLFTARYPRELFSLVMGLNRWVYRVIAYAALMRDEYPPFRLDLGGSEPAVAATGLITPEEVPADTATTS